MALKEERERRDGRANFNLRTGGREPATMTTTMRREGSAKSSTSPGSLETQAVEAEKKGEVDARSDATRNDTLSGGTSQAKLKRVMSIKDRHVKWEKAGSLAKQLIVERRVRRNRIIAFLMLMILPISLGLLANHYKHVLPLDFLFGQRDHNHNSYYGQAMDYINSKIVINGPRADHKVKKKHEGKVGLMAEESSKKSDVINVLLPEFLAPAFKKVYDEKLSANLEDMYNKTVHFDTVSMSEWQSTIQQDAKKRSMSRYDVYVLLSTWIPTFAEQACIADMTSYLKDLDSSYWEDVLPQIRENVASYNNKIYALPTDGDVILMMYNRRILNKYGLEPPETWQEWIEISKKLHGKDLDGDGNPDAGACVVTEPNGFWASLFFAFASPFLQTYGSDEGIFFDTNTMKPVFSHPKFSYILDLYKEMIDHSIHNLIGMTSWQQANQLFLEEKCALLYNFHGSLKIILTQMESGEAAENFRMKMIPGSKYVLSADGKEVEVCDELRCPYADKNHINHAPFYGEGGIGIAFNFHASPDILEAATSFAVTLTGPEHSLPLVTSVGSLLDPYRYSHFSNIKDPTSAESKVYINDGWNHRSILQWQNSTVTAFEHSNGVKDLAIYGKALYTGEYGFESMLSDFVKGKVDSSETRMKLEKAWTTLTGRYGLEMQQKLYRRSLGLPTTALEVPIVIICLIMISILSLVFLSMKNGQLRKRLEKEKRESASLKQISKWSTLISNNPASRLMKVLQDVQSGKQVDAEIVGGLLKHLKSRRGSDFWMPDLNNNEFAKVSEENKPFADYLKLNLMNNFHDTKLGSSRRGSRSNRSNRSGSGHGGASRSTSSDRNISDLLKSASSNDSVLKQRRSLDDFIPDSPLSKSLNDVDSMIAKGKQFWVPVESLQTLKDIGSWNIDPFHVCSISNGHPILTIMYNLFTQNLDIGKHKSRSILSDLNINEEKFWRYVQVIESQMRPENVYHNAIHVADVAHNMLWLLQGGGMAERLNLTKFEVFAALFAAMIHDFDHPGVSNDFLVRTSHRRAIFFNNQSVNENWHVAMAFGLLQREDQELAWDEEWSEDTMFQFRKLCISMVLATDMSRHFELLGKFKNRIAECNSCDDAFDSECAKDRELVLVMAIKASDIATQGKAWKLARKWATIVQEEFFSQGDKEKELGLVPSPLCDRENVDIVKSQIGFIDAVLFPLYEPLSKVLPEVKSVLVQLKKSKSMYEKELRKRSNAPSDES